VLPMPRHDRSRGSRRRRVRRRHQQGTVSIIDSLLLRPSSITLNGQAQKVPTIEAILLQLLEKAVSGNGRAWQVLVRYQDFARRRMKKELQLTFLDSEYTRALANSKPRSDND
jgi:hypothetical protein